MNQFQAELAELTAQQRAGAALQRRPDEVAVPLAGFDLVRRAVRVAL